MLEEHFSRQSVRIAAPSKSGVFLSPLSKHLLDSWEYFLFHEIRLDRVSGM